LHPALPALFCEPNLISRKNHPIKPACNLFDRSVKHEHICAG